MPNGLILSPAGSILIWSARLKASRPLLTRLLMMPSTKSQILSPISALALLAAFAAQLSLYQVV